MEYRKVTAIVRGELLEKVERRLQDIGVHGISVTHVKGYGEYADFYSSDWNIVRAKIEIFTDKDQAEEIAAAILDSAHTGLPGDGIVTVMPVEKIFITRSRAEPGPGEI
jgi:nitrogen regulatory protein P-II 1